MKLDRVTTARNLPHILAARFQDKHIEIFERSGIRTFCVVTNECVVTFAPELPLNLVQAILAAITIEVELV